jgi:hypothetical protein
MPKVITDEVANQIANEVLALIKSKDGTFKSNQIVAVLNAARVIEMNARPAKQAKVETTSDQSTPSA